MPEDEIKEEIFKIFEEWGLSQGSKRVLGRVYAVLWLKSAPMETKEIEKASGYSLSTTRSTLDVLEKHHFVRRIKRAHEKKLFYECSKDMAQNFQNSMQNTLNQNLRTALLQIENLKNSVRNRGNEKLLEKVEEFETEFERLSEYIENILKVELPKKRR